VVLVKIWAPSWSYGSWIYNYLCNQCLSLLKLWVRTPFMTRCTRYNIMWLATGRWFSPGTPVSSTNKTDRHDITEILLKVVLNIINQPNQPKGILKIGIRTNIFSLGINCQLLSLYYWKKIAPNLNQDHTHIFNIKKEKLVKYEQILTEDTPSYWK